MQSISPLLYFSMLIDLSDTIHVSFPLCLYVNGSFRYKPCLFSFISLCKLIFQIQAMSPLLYVSMLIDLSDTSRVTTPFLTVWIRSAVFFPALKQRRSFCGLDFLIQSWQESGGWLMSTETDRWGQRRTGENRYTDNYGHNSGGQVRTDVRTGEDGYGQVGK